MQYHQGVRRGFHLPAGRVISLGRLMLGTLFLLSMLFDQGSPEAPRAVGITVALYVVLAALIVLLTWNDWWRDVQLAGSAHALDILLFTVLVGFTEGNTSAFYPFCMFILLSAAIRWGWRATALSAVLLTLMFVLAGALGARGPDQLHLQPFLLRTGNLVILSLILIWFGINQWRRLPDIEDDETLETIEAHPLAAALRTAMAAMNARSGLVVWEEATNNGPAMALTISDRGEAERCERAPRGEENGEAFLYDIHRGRALTRDENDNLHGHESADLMPADALALGLSEGLSFPVRSGSGHGRLYLDRIPRLASDHLLEGKRLGGRIAARMQRHDLFRAAEESAEARSRLALARDLHDSVVQFLAGAAFRLEAMKRTAGSDRDLEPELNELKQLMLQEQGELREFIAALRSGSRIAATELASDLASLAERVARQWDIKCDFSAETEDAMLPTRLQIDATHLLREAVANAVRHAGAKTVTIKLRAGKQALELDFINDGTRYPKSPLDGDMPRSIKERVELAGGTLDLSRGMGVTRISLSLPVGRSRL